MNILKIGLVLISGAGFTFGISKIDDQEMYNDYSESTYFEEFDYYNGHMGRNRGMGYSSYHCLPEEVFFEHLLDHLSEEDALIVETKINDMLIEYGVTYEELYESESLKIAFMNELFDFMEINDIEFGYHSYRYNE